jgi:SAM-dependent methyltransferase
VKSQWASQLVDKYYKAEDHPFNIFEKKISSHIQYNHTIVDAGCGSEAPLLINFIGKASKLIGIDLVEFHPSIQDKGLLLLNTDLAKTQIEDSSVDLVISRSVLEHISDVESVYKEINRILRPGGTFLFLIPNLLDYVSIISYMIPNRFHKAIVSKISGRPDENTFQTYYKSNTSKTIRNLSSKTGFDVVSVDYYGQYPYMLEFNKLLFLLGVLYDKTITRLSCLKYFRGWLLVELNKREQFGHQ